MIAEAIDKILALAGAQELNFFGKSYTDRKVFEVERPEPEPLMVNTLTAIVDYVNLGLDKNAEIPKIAIHIVDHEQVEIVTDLEPVYMSRDCLVRATRKNHAKGFEFGKLYDAERFIIELQAHFQPTADLTKILKVAGNMKAERVTSSADDGVTQSVSTRAGVVLSSVQEVPNPVVLEPYRTFLEIDQPQSNFVFRVHQSRDGELPKCALYEADGGKWKLDAIKSLMEYFKLSLPSVTVIA